MFEKTTPWLDHWATSWHNVRTRICVDNRLDRTLTDDLRVRAEDCLDDLRSNFVALLGDLTHADAGTLNRATTAAAGPRRRGPRAPPLSGSTSPACARRAASAPPPRLTTIDLAQHAQSHFQLALRGSNVALHISSDARPVVVEADPSQLARAFHNLALNARQAMPNGGNVRLDVRCCQPSVALVDEQDGRWAVLTISDDGPGIREEHLDKIFDPYFSTRPDGHGLGLAVVHSVIRRHGGRLRVCATVGVGTTFEIYLPCADQVSDGAGLRARERDTIDLAGRRVLVVDDQPEIHRAIHRVMTHLGLSCTGVTKAAEAVDTYRRQVGSTEPFDVVVRPDDAGRHAARAAPRRTASHLGRRAHHRYERVSD